MSSSGLVDFNVGSEVDTIVLVDKVSSTLTYVGSAIPGSLTSEAKWQIQRVQGTTLVTVLFANGNADFTNIWDNRASLSYS
jgi:hypothetical protein